MVSIFDKLLDKHSTLFRSIYSKSSMRAISHALEDVVINLKLEAEIFVTFQEFKFFLQEKERYLHLDGICRRIFVFAQNIDYSRVKDFKSTVFINVGKEEQLAKEWNVIINHPAHPMILATREEGVYKKPIIDEFRSFRGFLTFAPSVVEEAVKYFVSYLCSKGINYTPVYRYLTQLSQVEEDFNLKTQLFLNRLLDEVEYNVNQLQDKNVLLERALRENKKLTLEMVQRLCYAAEYRDEDTAAHLVRISCYAAALYSLVETDKTKVENMRYAALMHDIGKIGIPDAILFKPAKLTREEYEIMKTHTIIGARILSGSSKEVIKMGRDIAYYHHERWDGSGYPTGKKGRSIPLPARVAAVVDVFDALSTKRVYKPAYPLEICIQELKQERNKQFDGELVDLFIDNLDMFLEIKDETKSMQEDLLSMTGLFPGTAELPAGKY